MKNTIQNRGTVTKIETDTWIKNLWKEGIKHGSAALYIRAAVCRWVSRERRNYSHA